MLNKLTTTPERLYRWRKNFPNCNNVYAKQINEVPGQRCIYNPYKNDLKFSNAFTNGGFSFLPNPFEYWNLKANKDTRPQIMSTFDLDNAADYSSIKHDYKKASIPSRASRNIEEKKE